MLGATRLRNNTCFLYKNEPYRVLKYKHTHLSRRGADIKVKCRNLVSGDVLRLSFSSNHRFEEPNLVRKKMQYLYKDEEYVFMDPSDFEQVSISSVVIGNKSRFLQEGNLYDVLFWEDRLLDLELPSSIVLLIKKCDPGVKGNSATNIFKFAVCDNGFKLRVPLFIKVGDKVKVDVEGGQYIERLKDK